MSGEDTKLALMRAAEKLFAQKGVNGVSLREVSLAAHQGNQSAAHYHYGSKIALIDAILLRHSTAIQEHWITLIDHLERRDECTMRALIDVMVRPIVAKLDDADGGPQYLSLCAQLATNPSHPLIERPISSGAGAQRLAGAVMNAFSPPHSLTLLRMDRVALTLYLSIASYSRLAQGGIIDTSRELFIADLIDTLTALVSTEPSVETDALL